MRVSLWRQWSSNHSSSFHVVGRFASPGDAAAAADELRTILSQLAAESARSNSYEISPLEREIRLRYDIPDLSSQAISADDPTLFADDAFGSNPAGAVRAIDQLVLLSSDETYVESLAHEALMARLGAADVWADSEEISSLVATIEVSCKDEESSDVIYSELRMYFDSAPRPFWYLRSDELPLLRLYYAPVHALVEPWAWAAEDPNAYSLKADGAISRAGLDLTIRIQFEVLQVGLPALRQYLENCGAERFAYRFERRRHESYERRLLLYPTAAEAAAAEALLRELMTASLDGAETLRYDQMSESERALYARLGLEAPRWPMRYGMPSLVEFEQAVAAIGPGLVVVGWGLAAETMLALIGGAAVETLRESTNDFSGTSRIQITLAAAGADEALAAGLEDELARYLAWVTIGKQFRSPENEARLRRFAAEHPAAKLAIPWGGDERAHAYGKVERRGADLALTLFFRMLEQGLPRLLAYLAGRGFAVTFEARMHPDQYLVL
ncbi:MAG TPA: hypothetical protein VGE07_29020 [Herpetosiphonaceae bacterium]